MLTVLAMRPPHSKRHAGARRHGGFTLIEIIVVIVISAIIGGSIFLVIRAPVENYVATAERSELADTADASLRMMSRELRSAVPNSVRISAVGGVSLLEFIPAVGGGRYYTVSDVPAGQQFLSFTNDVLSFSPISLPPPDGAPIALNQNIIVYNLGSDFQLADAYQSGILNGNRARVTGLGVPLGFNSPELDGVNPFRRAGQGSPSQRFIVATTPVTYRCQPTVGMTRGQLTRLQGYGYLAAQADPAPLNPVTTSLVALDVLACSFNAGVTATRNTSLVMLSVTLRRQGTQQDSVELFGQVMLDNTP